MLRFTACAAALLAFCATARASEPPHSAELDDMIVRQAKRHGVPEKLVRRIVMRESRYNPRARNHSFWGLMQISYPTARSMGFKGSPSELLDPLVNLTYAVPYLANAFVIAGKEEDAAVRLYASGYYTTAKNRNLLDHLRTADSTPVVPDDGFLVATARPVSNLITAVVGAPPLQVAAAAPPPVAAGTIGGGAANEPEVMMTAGKKGYQPPKRWLRDGGVTDIARGEQRVEIIAGYVPPPGAEPTSKEHHVASRGKSRKITDFAALDVPPANAQAYAAPSEAAIPQSAPQAAIAQMTAGSAAAPTAQAQAQVDEPATEAAPVKRTKAHTHKVLAKKKDAETVAPVATAASDGSATPAADQEKPEKKKPVPRKVAAKAKPAHEAKKPDGPAVAVAAKAEEPATKWRPFGSK